jgi:peptide/nickel transport system substrate-binding protein
MCNVLKPFTDRKVRQAINYLVPRAAMMKSVYFDTARPTKSPISEIYPGFIDKYFGYGMDVDVKKAKQLLTEAGFPKGFKTQLGYRSGDQLEEEIAVILKTSFAQAGIELELLKMPASTLVEKYSKAQMPMYFFRDMAIVPDAAYVANLWLHSISPIDYSRYKNPEVDKRIEWALSSTDEPKRLQAMAEVQKYTMDDAPWVFLFNPGYQLATRSNVKGFSWYTPNGNNWYDFYKD